MTTKLKLPPLPGTECVKVALTLPLALHRDLTRYAELHAEVSGGKADLARLIPHMLDAFLRSDRAFRRARRNGG